MCNAFNHPADCTCGWGGEGYSGASMSAGGWAKAYEPAPSNSAWLYRDSYAAPTKCSRCGGDVYFIRHNGGSVWVDELGWPWPKHACIDDTPEPSWFTYLRTTAGRALAYPGSTLPVTGRPFRSLPSGFAGVVVRARRFSIAGQAVIILAIDGGHTGRRLAAIDGSSNTADYYLGCIAAIDREKRNIATSNHKVKPLKAVEVAPEELGLRADWLERVHDRPYEPAPSNSAWLYRDSYAAPTECSRCGGGVYLIRHNGGSVLVDELGWPWPKHACIDNTPEPSWFKYLRTTAGRAPAYPGPTHPVTGPSFGEPPSGFAGVVVKARRFSIADQAVIILAVDGGHTGRRVAAIEGNSNTAEYYLGCIAAIDRERKNIAMSNHKVKPLKAVAVPPEELGLPADWLEQVHDRA